VKKPRTRPARRLRRGHPEDEPTPEERRKAMTKERRVKLNQITNQKGQTK
jgi:hypothetical protein